MINHVGQISSYKKHRLLNLNRRIGTTLRCGKNSQQHFAANNQYCVLGPLLAVAAQRILQSPYNIFLDKKVEKSPENDLQSGWRKPRE